MDGDAEMEMVSVTVSKPTTLDALMVTVLFPASVGVPEMIPVVVFPDNPEGSPVAL